MVSALLVVVVGIVTANVSSGGANNNVLVVGSKLLKMTFWKPSTIYLLK